MLGTRCANEMRPKLHVRYCAKLLGGELKLGAAGVEVAQNVLADTQVAVLPLVPYLDTLR